MQDELGVIRKGIMCGAALGYKSMGEVGCQEALSIGVRKAWNIFRVNGRAGMFFDEHGRAVEIAQDFSADWPFRVFQNFKVK